MSFKKALLTMCYSSCCPSLTLLCLCEYILAVLARASARLHIPELRCYGFSWAD